MLKNKITQKKKYIKKNVIKKINQCIYILHLKILLFLFRCYPSLNV